MARISELTDAQRRLVDRLSQQQASPLELGELAALQMNVVDVTDRRAIEAALTFQQQEVKP